jgi:di/tricarboxylate transporter
MIGTPPNTILTPSGHQLNTLDMGPGRYRFGGDWQVGLPLSVVVPAIAVLLFLLAWPLRAP